MSDVPPSDREPADDYDTAPLDEDPEGAPTANAFIVQVTAGMLLVVALFVAGATTESGILIALALVVIAVGALVVMTQILRMTSTDSHDDEH
ncbi:MAG: hypothetical protein AB7G37_04650 [Solirubrobacteraceae bacterium]